MQRIPKTLILTHFPAGMRNGTIRHLEALFEHYPDDLVWYSSKSPVTQVVAPAIPYAHGGYLTRPSRARRLRSYLNFGPWAWGIGRRAAAYGRQHGAKVVMAVMSGEVIVAATAAAKALGVPLAVWVSDDPPSSLAHTSLPRHLQSFVASRFENAMKRSCSHGVISTDLAELYRQKFGVNAFVLYKGVARDTCLPAPTGVDLREITIGSVGTINSAENWQLLIRAVQHLNAAGQRRYRILHVGDLPDNMKSPDVDSTGWVAPGELGAALERFDLCFLTLWFDEASRTHVRTALPTKITSYIQAQRPIVAFGLPESRIVRLVGEYGCGVACTTPSAVDLANAIERVLDSSHYRQAVAGMERLRDAFSMDVFYANFEAFIRRAEGTSHSARRETP